MNFFCRAPASMYSRHVTDKLHHFWNNFSFKKIRVHVINSNFQASTFGLYFPGTNKSNISYQKNRKLIAFLQKKVDINFD